MPRTACIPLLLLSTAAVAVAQPALARHPAHAAAARAPHLTADPSAVHPGGTLKLTGRGFPHRARIVLLARTGHRPAIRIGSARSGRTGRFVATIRIRARAAAGRFVVLACHDACRVSASVRFRIVAP